MKKWIWRSLFSLIVLLIFAAGGFWFYLRMSLPKTSGSVRVSGVSGEIEIIRDSRGIPHIFAGTDDDAIFALGYAHAQDRLWQMEVHRRIGAGRMSEVFGEPTMKTDMFLRTLGVYRAAENAWKHLGPSTQAVFKTYVAGVNAFLAEKQILPPEFLLLGVRPEPWTVIDSLVWAKMMSWDLGGDYKKELLRARLRQALGEKRGREILPDYPDDGISILADAYVSKKDLEKMLSMEDELSTQLGMRGLSVGSNNWVVSGRFTESGKPMLANDPHLATRIPSVWYFVEIHGVSLHVAGATLPSLPGLTIGHNDHIAWGLTNLGPDVQDLFVEKINPSNPNQYLADGEWVDMEIVEEIIRVKGRAEPVLWAARSTRNGPLISDVQDTQTPVALRWTTLDDADTTVETFQELAYATNWDEFREALKKFVAPSQNFVYADREGNIGYYAPGRIPIRKNGKGLYPAPGWDGSHAWDGWVPFDELPHSFNPEEGFVATANNRAVGPDYPYLIANFWEPPFRAQRIRRMLKERISSGEKFRFEDHARIQLDVTSEQALEMLPYLRKLNAESETEREALALLQQWDGSVTRDSAAAVLYEMWLHRFERLLFKDDLRSDLYEWMDRRFHSILVRNVLRNPELGRKWCDNVLTPPIENCSQLMHQALKDALEVLAQKLGARIEEWRWGDLHQTQYPHRPFSQVSWLKPFFHRGVENGGDKYTVNVASHKARNPFMQTHHPSFRMLLDLADWNRQRFILGTGQSGHPVSPHYDDQMTPHRNGEYYNMTYGKTHAKGDVLILRPR